MIKEDEEFPNFEIESSSGIAGEVFIALVFLVIAIAYSLLV